MSCRRCGWPLWVKNGYGARSTGTSAVPQIADDFGAPRKSAEVGQQATFISRVYSGPLLMPHIAPQKLISHVTAEMVKELGLSEQKTA